MKALARVGCVAVAFLVLATAADAVSGREYVLWTGRKVYVTADGHNWRQVTPRGAVQTATFRAIDAVAFRKSRGWLISSDCATGRGSVYRSFDGGRSWKAYAFHAHSCAGGANFSLDVDSDSRAWVLQNEPSGPNSRVYRTTNGGRSWRLVARLATYGGKVAFASPSAGWLAGQRLLRTVDGGQSWEIQPLPAPDGYDGRLVILTAPHFFGRAGVLAGQYGSAKPVIGFYRTVDRGRSWHLLATLPGSVPGIFPQFVLTSASASTSWLLTAGTKPAVHVTRDGGRHWSSHGLAQRLYAPVALNARVAAASDFHGVPYITRDGGRTWRRLKL
jgi:photosystem II stability/assembly factor-like uncharacterized protein